MSPEEQITKHIEFVPDHSQVDAYLASLRANPAQVVVMVSPGAVAPGVPATVGNPGAVAPSVVVAEFGQTTATGDDTGAASTEGKPVVTVVAKLDRDDVDSGNAWHRSEIQSAAGDSRDTSKAGLESRPFAVEEAGNDREANRNGDNMGFHRGASDESSAPTMETGIDAVRIGFLANQNDIRRSAEQSAYDIYRNPAIAGPDKAALANQQLQGGIMQEQKISQGLLHNLQPEELNSINQQATSGPGTADVGEALRKAAADIAEMRNLLNNGVNTAEIIKQLLQALKAM